jgi:hypothetical protein
VRDAATERAKLLERIQKTMTSDGERIEDTASRKWKKMD